MNLRSRRVLYTYEIEVGVPPPLGRGAFPLEPDMKEEQLLFHHRGRHHKLLERRGPSVMARDADGKRTEISRDLLPSETALGAFDAPQRFPDIHAIKQLMLDWRFYHDLRTDQDSALRRPCLAVATPTMASDGSNLAAVLATLIHIRRDTVDLDRAIEDAFPGARLDVPMPEQAASFGMVFPDYPKRVFEARELSDGTLRYLALAGALLSLRLPSFIALNEPESSLHPDLLEPLGPADRQSVGAHAGLAGDAFGAAGRGAGEAWRRGAAHGDQEGRRDLDRRPEDDRPLRRRGLGVPQHSSLRPPEHADDTVGD